MIEPLGATLTSTGVHFAVWSTNATRIDVIVDGQSFALQPTGKIFAATVEGITAGARYHFSVDGAEPRPDPRSRFQPEGVHGPSQVVDPANFRWTDQSWTGLQPNGLVIYELHIGTFTQAGTFRAAMDQLPDLAELGIDAIELMPIAAFPGRRNWGYDGVDLFAPSENYGRPEDLQALIDAAHQHGIGVILDVVYNHFGPDGSYLREYSDEYFTHEHLTPWGDAINYDGPQSQHVRQFMIDNAVQWVRDYHFDGFRFDATEQIVDSSPTHILAEIGKAARAVAGRPIVLIAEEARNLVEVVHPVTDGGLGFDSAWADDFHHSLFVFLTAIQDHYYVDYSGTLTELATAINFGFIYQGQESTFRGKTRGTVVTNEAASAFTYCLQNHDQIGNQPFGERLHHDIDRERYAVASTLLLFLPNTIILFMGQESMASAPFLFFTDHSPELGGPVTEGRRHEFAGLRAFGNDELVESIPDPQAEETFLVSKLRPEDRARGGAIGRLYADLIRMRKADPVLHVHDRMRTHANNAGARTMIVRRWSEEGARILIANFGATTNVPITLEHATLANVAVLFNSSETLYGGSGDQPEIRTSGTGVTVSVPARTAVILAVPLDHA